MSFADFFADMASDQPYETQPVLDADFDTLNNPEQISVGLHEFLESPDSAEWL